MSEDKSQNKSIGFASGLALGTIIAAGAVFLYKTEKGKKFKRIFFRYYSDVNDYLDEVIKRIKKEAKRMEGNQEQSKQAVKKKSATVKKSSPKRAKTISRHRVFRRLGKPLIK